MKVDWQYVAGSNGKHLVFCKNDGDNILEVFADVWRTPSGRWSFLIGGDFVGTEPNKKLAVIKANDVIRNFIFNGVVCKDIWLNEIAELDLSQFMKLGKENVIHVNFKNKNRIARS